MGRRDRNDHDMRVKAAACIHKPFQEADIRETLDDRSSQGPDGVTNKVLRNLDDSSIRVTTAEVVPHLGVGSISRRMEGCFRGLHSQA